VGLPAGLLVKRYRRFFSRTSSAVKEGGLVSTRTYSDMVGAETAHKYQTFVYLAGSASAEFFADIGLCPFEAVKVRQDAACESIIYYLYLTIFARGMSGQFTCCM
jgi:hypothetical protein